MKGSRIAVLMLVASTLAAAAVSLTGGTLASGASRRS
jgi:hypothetical protein